MLLSRINANEYDIVDELRKCYIDIKNKLLQELYQRASKMKKKIDNITSLLKYIYNEGYDRGTRDTSAKYTQLQKKYNQIETENKFLKEIIDNSLPKNKRGHVRQNLIETPTKIQINKPIIQEIPELIYTDNLDDYVEESQLKVIYEQNKFKYKISKSITECIKEIKNKLNANQEYNSLIDGIIFKCKIVYNTNTSVSKKKNIKICEDNMDNEEM